MFASQDDQPTKNWMPYIIAMAATAILSTVGAELAKWGIDELRNKYGTKPPKEEEKKTS